MNIAIYQMEIIAGNPNLNREKVEKWINQVCADQKDKPQLIVLPELWTTGYQLESLTTLAEERGEQTISFLSKLAIKHKLHMIAGSIATKKEGRIYNTAIVIRADGECIYSYNKMHLVPMLNEPTYLDEGMKAPAVFELDGIKMGVVICYDLRFPEIIRNLMLQGAEVLFIPAEWPRARTTHWEILQQARAIENQFFVLSANGVGFYKETEYAGRSLVVNPWGDIIASGSIEKEETILTKIDFSEVEQVRRQVPIQSSRRPHLYS
ncbi:omega amidase [Bacillus sp. JCM 19046]|uniref:Amidohydrolase n=1 Tax=Shouchella xiaoxiensis TaxID=766895 RepID=A0ABS2T474_9BACI|nr:carbon-nitrogen family hydrolase [Shouchella xiaoxiensis]MBM7841257.1 putative amidohydrolase [Shouchella xiaoxiensis]GAF15314.1 omega amidase [Bacillus sp. JCM 19045]GAF19821.1 omega amidase [Bacillus sp. JCM 19046]